MCTIDTHRALPDVLAMERVLVRFLNVPDSKPWQTDLTLAGTPQIYRSSEEGGEK